MPAAGEFPSTFHHSRAYIFGNRRKSGTGVVPQCEPWLRSLCFGVFSKSHALLYSDPNDYVFVLGRARASAAAAIMQQVFLQLCCVEV
jgi:hypothetical protein